LDGLFNYLYCSSILFPHCMFFDPAATCCSSLSYWTLKLRLASCWASFNFALLDGRLESCIIQAYIVIN